MVQFLLNIIIAEQMEVTYIDQALSTGSSNVLISAF